ncbi:MAG: hypothetical protein CME19_07170 [Gemmatimonadetes bacterium]|nr:hypothetical protein [Gemmatimonadota bacterium]|tara:strand:+ start:1871 stop:2932 length:1062 start_codon:yes stop_codon:yes gene_type:complete
MKDIFFGQDDLARVKREVEAGNEPWVTAYTHAMELADKALSQEPVTVTRKGPGRHEYWTDSPYGGWNKVDGGKDTRDGQINPQADRGDYYAAIALENAVRDLGIAYVFSDDEQYAEKAVSLIRTWCLNSETYMSPELTNGQSPIELFVTIPGMFYGGGLCENSSAWSNGEWDAWLDWVDAFSKSVTAREFTNNFANWKVVLLAISAIVRSNDAELGEAFQMWRDLIPDQVADDGHLVREIGRTKSLDYSTYALNAMVLTASIAARRGVDLFTEDVDGKGLEQVLDYHAPFVVDAEAWPYEQIAPYKGDNIALYEQAYAWQQKSEYKAAIDKWDRPMYEHRIGGPVTLTNGVGV